MSATPPPGLTPAPTPVPQRGDRATFAARVDAFVAWLTAAVPQFGALAANVYNNAVIAFDSAAAALASRNQAEAQANGASAHRTAAESAAASAQNWASRNDGGPVVANTYSSLHYALMSQAAAAMAGNTVAFADTLPVIKNAADPSKRCFFSAAGIASGTDRTLALPNKNGTIALLGDLAPAQNSAVTVNGGNGVGTTNTKIRRFTTLVSSIGTAISYADSSAGGASFTINEDGIYAISYLDLPLAGGSVGASRNASAASAIDNIGSGANTTFRLFVNYNQNPSAQYVTYGTVVVRLSAADIVRPHIGGDVVAAAIAGGCSFTIRKIAL